jgi:hypothetical protein
MSYLLTYLLTELSPSWEAANYTATHKLPSILWNPKVQYRVHKSPLLVPVLSHINPIHFTSSHPISLWSILILSTHLSLGLPRSLFPSGFPANISYMHRDCVFKNLSLCVPLLELKTKFHTHITILRANNARACACRVASQEAFRPSTTSSWCWLSASQIRTDDSSFEMRAAFQWTCSKLAT